MCFMRFNQNSIRILSKFYKQSKFYIGHNEGTPNVLLDQLTIVGIGEACTITRGTVNLISNRWGFILCLILTPLLIKLDQSQKLEAQKNLSVCNCRSYIVAHSKL